jgi:hypothetical protein
VVRDVSKAGRVEGLVLVTRISRIISSGFEVRLGVCKLTEFDGEGRSRNPATRR